MAIYTVGYEGATLEVFLERLQSARVETVVDVRDLPLSRRRGFSKNALAAALRAAGIEYQHVRALGCPKHIRDQYRKDRNWVSYTAAFMQHLSNQLAAVAHLASLGDARTSALLCYEADARFCHRTYVARAATALCGGTVLHITAAGITPDSVG